MIIDCHTHIDQGKNPRDLIASMDEAGIDISILLANDSFLDFDGTNTQQAIEICEKFDRLRPVGSIIFDRLDEDLNKIKSYLQEDKILGIKLYPGYENFYPTDEKLLKLYDFCEKEDKTVIFHTGILMSGTKGLLKQVHPLNIDEIAHQFPNLKIIMAHFGNPWIMDCAAVVSKNSNVYVDLSGYFAENVPISEVDRDVFILDLTRFKDFVGSFKKCLFGSDYPLYSQKEYLAAVRKLPMGEEERELVFSQNAKNLFHL